MAKKVLFLFLAILPFFVQAQTTSHLQTLAAQGNAEAQYRLALRYAEGKDVAQNFQKAFYWLSQASGREHPSAMNYLGLCYCNGIGTEKNLTKAYQLFHEAAAKNDKEGQYNLAYCFYYGEGISQNYEQAVYWFEKAAKQNHPEAKNKLGECYKNGEGVKQNYAKAIYWFQQAAKDQNIAGEYNLGMLYYLGEGVEQSYTKAIEWLSLAAERNSVRSGHPWAQYYLGLCYKNALGIKRDYAKAAQNFSYAATQHYAPAQQELGICYENGLGVVQNYATAYTWFLESNAQELDLHYKNLQVFTNFFIENEVLNARKKRPNESDTDYQKRLETLQCDSVTTAFYTQKAADTYLEIKKRHYHYEPLKIDRYNLIDESFTLISAGLEPFFVQVNASEAESFKSHFDKMRQTPTFVLENEEVSISEFTLFLREKNLTYKTYRIAPTETEEPLSDNEDDEKL